MSGPAEQRRSLPGVLFLLVAIVLGCEPASAVEAPDLYRAEAVVTGTEEPERTRGFREGLAETIVKLTGDPRLLADPRLAETLRDPGRFVTRYEYEDRMKNLPVHDEQGTRERPHFLRMQFHPALLRGELQRLRLRPWTDRPPIAVWLGIRTEGGSYGLAATGPEGYGQRLSLLRSAERRGLRVVLPGNEQADRLTFEDIAAAEDVSKLEALSEPGSALLSGVLAIAEGGHWNIEWRLSHAGRSREWRLDGITFDAALRDGLDTAALLLSGNLPF